MTWKVFLHASQSWSQYPFLKILNVAVVITSSMSKGKKCALKLLCYVNWHQNKIVILLRNFMSFVLLNHKLTLRFFVPSFKFVLVNETLKFRMQISKWNQSQFTFPNPTQHLQFLERWSKTFLDLNQLHCYLAMEKRLMRLSGPWFAYHKTGPVCMTSMRLEWMHVNIWCGTWHCCFRNVLG